MPAPTQIILAYQMPFTRLDPALQLILFQDMPVDSGETEKIGLDPIPVSDVTTPEAYGFRRVITYTLLALFFENFPDAATSGPNGIAACSNLYTRVLQQKMPTECVGEVPVFA